jgi:hypothetical protein
MLGKVLAELDALEALISARRLTLPFAEDVRRRKPWDISLSHKSSRF